MPYPRLGLMLVLSSPSGAGKTTLARKLIEQETQNAQKIRMSVSVTTRPMRPGEVEGKDYFFVDAARFTHMIAQDELLEHAQVFDNFYGTPASFVKECLSAGVDVLFDVDWQGNQALTRSSRENLVSVFILPPSMEELERRLKSRAQDSSEIVARRMQKASAEISHWQEYDYVVINHDIESTLANITSILTAERLKRSRQTTLPAFVSGLIG